MTTEGPTSDLLRRMLAAITATSAHGDVDRLLAAARAQAEAEVTDVVKSAMKASLLKEILSRLESGAEPHLRDEAARGDAPQTNDPPEAVPETPEEPASADNPPPATASYVYAITRDPPDHLILDTPSIAPEYPLEAVRHRELAAIVSEVPLDDFNQSALDERVSDRHWVEEKVRAHDDVIRSVAARSTAIPCRFCTIVRGPGDVRALLATHYDRILATLERLDGRQEWGVKICFDPGAVSTQGFQPAQLSGKDYLQQRQQRDARRTESHRHARDLAKGCHAALSELADDSMLLPLRSTSGDSIELLNAAYLVRADQTDAFHQRITDLLTRHASDGLDLTLTGPWPAYNFAHLDLTLEAAA